MHISGEYDRDWHFVDEEHERVEQPEQASAVCFRLSENVWEILPSEKPITVPNGNHYREEYDRQGILKSTIPTSHDIFWIGETVSIVALQRPYVGMIRSQALAGDEVIYHVSSQAIYGGETDWRLRTELFRNGNGEIYSYQTNNNGSNENIQRVFMEIYQ